MFIEPIESVFTSIKVLGGNRTMVVVQRLQEKIEKTACTMDFRSLIKVTRSMSVRLGISPQFFQMLWSLKCINLK